MTKSKKATSPELISSYKNKRILVKTLTCDYCGYSAKNGLDYGSHYFHKHCDNHSGEYNCKWIVGVRNWYTFLYGDAANKPLPLVFELDSDCELQSKLDTIRITANRGEKSDYEIIAA